MHTICLKDVSFLVDTRPLEDHLDYVTLLIIRYIP